MLPDGLARGLVVVALVAASACDTATDGKPARVAAAAPAADAAAAVAAMPPVDAAVDAPAGAVLQIAPHAPRPGTSSTITFDATLDFDLNFGTYGTVTSSRQEKKKKVEILAVHPDGTVEKRISYLKRKTHIVVDGEEKKDHTVLPGKTFRVTWKEGKIVQVRRDNGKPATAAEVEGVRGEEILLQTPEMLGAALAGLQLVEGQPFEVPAHLITSLLAEEFVPKRVILIYRGQVGEAARLDAQVAMESEGEGMKMYVDLDGELLFDRTGWCLQADITAQVRAEFGGVVVGSGAGVGAVKATPLR